MSKLTDLLLELSSHYAIGKCLRSNCDCQSFCFLYMFAHVPVLDAMLVCFFSVRHVGKTTTTTKKICYSTAFKCLCKGVSFWRTCSYHIQRLCAEHTWPPFGWQGWWNVTSFAAMPSFYTPRAFRLRC